MSLPLTADANLRSSSFAQDGNLTVRQFFFLALLLTLGATAADQFVAPALFTSSPLWATALCLALVWRRGKTEFERERQTSNSSSSNDWTKEAGALGFSLSRVSLFVCAHVSLVSVARFWQGPLEPVASSFQSWITAGLKLSVLLPTLLLLPLKLWRILGRVYAAEVIAAVVVLFTFFPGRILTSIWPWYGPMLGRLVFFLSEFFVRGLTYTSALTPTVHGPQLDVTILLACSGISGIALFDYLFAFVVLLDWNRLRKGRTLLAYFAGIAALLAGNVLRITSFVILGNWGFGEVIARFHISAGWIFFSAVFLAYLSLTYGSLLIDANAKRKSGHSQRQSPHGMSILQ